MLLRVLVLGWAKPVLTVSIIEWPLFTMHDFLSYIHELPFRLVFPGDRILRLRLQRRQLLLKLVLLTAHLVLELL